MASSRVPYKTAEYCNHLGEHWLQDGPLAVGMKVVNHPLENPHFIMAL